MPLLTHQIVLHQFQSNRRCCFLEFGCTFPRTVVLLNVRRFSVFLHKLAALLPLLPYEYVPRPAPGVSRLERPDGRRWDEAKKSDQNRIKIKNQYRGPFLANLVSFFFSFSRGQRRYERGYKGLANALPDGTTPTSETLNLPTTSST